MTILGIYRAVFAREIFYKLNRLLYRCSLSGLGILNYESSKVSGEDVFLVKFLKGKGDVVVFDVGANIGSYTRAIHNASRNARIYAFEPHPATYKKLCENICDNNIELLNVAVGDAAGSLSLYDYELNDGSSHASLYKDVIENIHKAKAISHDVEVICLDQFSTMRAIEKITLLKIDTEGHELAVLKGAGELIGGGRIDAIHFEFNEMNVSSRTFFRDFWNSMPGYNFYRLLPNGMVEIDSYSPLFCEIFAYQNVVAIREDVSFV